jgi:hypothetical protein
LRSVFLVEECGAALCVALARIAAFASPQQTWSQPVKYYVAQTKPIDVAVDRASLVETEEEIPYRTRYYRKRRRPSMKEKAQGQQYLTPPKEKALVAFILQIGAVGTPVRVKYIAALAACLLHH